MKCDGTIMLCWTKDWESLHRTGVYNKLRVDDAAKEVSATLLRKRFYR